MNHLGKFPRGPHLILPMLLFLGIGSVIDWWKRRQQKRAERPGFEVISAPKQNRRASIRERGGQGRSL